MPAKSKYLPPMHETRIVEGYERVLGVGRGNMTAEERRSYIYPQAQNIVRKFGGPAKMAETIAAIYPNSKDHIHRTTIYRWMWPRHAGGTGGEIPLPSLQKVLKAARRAGVMLSPEDIYPKF
jgi:hypothetical protein